MRNILRAVAVCLAGLASLALADTTQWPNKPITLVVPFTPGGGNDNVARLISPALGEALGQSVVIDNRPGAGGTIGATAVANAAPDGYTLLICSTGNLTVAPALYSRLRYGVEDFVPVAQIANTPIVWVAAPQLAANNLQEFIALVRSQPGVYDFASSGNGTTPHLAGVALAKQHQLQMQHIPYKGSTPAYTDLASGRVSLMMDAVISALPMLQAGRVKALGVGTAQRLAQVPTAPTLAEQGLDALNYAGWVGICAPRGTPVEIVTKLNQNIDTVLARQNVREFLARQMAEPVGGSPHTFAQTIARDAARWGDIVKASGIKLD